MRDRGYTQDQPPYEKNRLVWTGPTRCSTEARGWKRAERGGAWRRRREEVRENGWLAGEAQDAKRLLDLCEVCKRLCSATDSAQLIAGYRDLCR